MKSKESISSEQGAEYERWLQESSIADLAKRLWVAAEEAYEKCLANPRHTKTFIVTTELRRQMLADQLNHHHGSHVDELDDDPDLSETEVDQMRRPLDDARERITVILMHSE